MNDHLRAGLGVRAHKVGPTSRRPGVRLVRMALVAATAVLAAATSIVSATPAHAILGGSQSTSAYSFMGSLQHVEYPETQEWDHHCGAVLVRPQWMLTAAHCVRGPGYDLGPSDLLVRIGSLQRRSGGELRTISQIVIHPSYGSNYDVAMLKLSSPSTMAPISLSGVTTVESTPVRLLGWGVYNGGVNQESAPLSDTLRLLDTSVTVDGNCTSSVNPGIEFCIPGTTSASACLGDSGGPALRRSGSSWILSGITSRGIPTEIKEACGGGGTVYSDVAAFQGWISGVLGEGGGSGGGGSSNHADLNGDGIADLLAVYDGSLGLYWYPGKGDGTFWSARYLDQAGFKLMAKGDLNGDGKADVLAIYESDGGLYWYPGKGDGTSWSARYLGQAGFRHMELADLNGDGKLDMLAIYDGTGGLYWYPGKGDGSFWSARYLGQAGFKNVAVGDLNGDGKADMLAVYDGSLGLYWYPGKGDGSFWSARYLGQAGFRHMELADLNGDGKRDMLAIYDGTGGLYWYPGKGDGSFWSARYLDQAGFKLMAL